MLILIAYIGKNLSNVLLFWACTMGAVVGLAYRLDQKLYKIDYDKSKKK